MVGFSIVRLSEIEVDGRIDAEFFRPDFVAASRELSCLRRRSLGSLATVTDGEHGSVTLQECGIKYLTAENVRQGFVDTDAVRYVGKDVDSRNARARVRPGDVLVSIKGTLGEVALAEAGLVPANMNRDVAIIKPRSDVKGDYLTAFLRSRFGAHQLQRESSGGVQQMITLERLRRIQVVRLGKVQEEEIGRLQTEGLRLREEARSMYQEAEARLEDQLGLAELANGRSVGYGVRRHDIWRSGRADAQHHHPMLGALLSFLSRFRTESLGGIRTYNRRGVQPVYVAGGGLSVVNSQHIGRRHIDYLGLEETSQGEFASCPEAHVFRDDVLMYATGAYVGRANVYSSDRAAMASNHVNIVRLVSGLDAAYVALLLQSDVGKIQTRAHARGSAQAELYPRDLDQFVVPVLEYEEQVSIGNMVRESLERELEGVQQIEAARRRVEDLVEECLRN